MRETKIDKATIVKSAMGGVPDWKHSTCQYSGKYKITDKYCTLTTNKVCRRCKFYDPTIGATIESFAILVREAEKTKNDIRHMTENTRALLDETEDFVDAKRNEVTKLEKECQKKVQAIRLMNIPITRQLWEDSVNTYGM